MQGNKEWSNLSKHSSLTILISMLCLRGRHACLHAIQAEASRDRGVHSKGKPTKTGEVVKDIREYEGLGMYYWY